MLTLLVAIKRSRLRNGHITDDAQSDKQEFFHIKFFTSGWLEYGQREFAAATAAAPGT
jgi:hypothetical protein